MEVAKTTNLNIRIDKEVKNQAEILLNEMGMTLSTAVNVFVRQLIREGRIPFVIGENRDIINGYDLLYIRQKLDEAEEQLNDSEIKCTNAREVMSRYQGKYRYAL